MQNLVLLAQIKNLTVQLMMVIMCITHSAGVQSLLLKGYSIVPSLYLSATFSDMMTNSITCLSHTWMMFVPTRCFVTSNYCRILRTNMLLRMAKNGNVLKCFFFLELLKTSPLKINVNVFHKKRRGVEIHIPIWRKEITPELGYAVWTNYLPSKYFLRPNKTNK